jgi:uncharacterized protein YdaU (DUF1376 family)
MKERSGMPYDVVAYETDELAMSLNEAAEGLFHRMLRRAWTNGSVPADMKALAETLRTRPATLRKAWPKLSKLWVPMEGRPDRLQNKKQESERAFKVELREKNSAAGKASAEARKRAKELAGVVAESNTSPVADGNTPPVENSKSEHAGEKKRIGQSKIVSRQDSVSEKTLSQVLQTNVDGSTGVQHNFNECSTSLPSPSLPLPSLLHSPNTETSPVRIKEPAEPGATPNGAPPPTKPANGRTRERTNGLSREGMQKLWGPVEGWLRGQVVEEAFNQLYAGIQVLDMTSRIITLAVPGAFIDQFGGHEFAAISLADRVRRSNTGFLRDRPLQLLKLEDVEDALER